MAPTEPPIFHAALRQLLADHDVIGTLGPRRTQDGAPRDDIEGRDDVMPRVRVTTLTLLTRLPREVANETWWGALNGLPGVIPYPVVTPHACGGSLVTIRWYDGSPAPTRPLPALR